MRKNNHWVLSHLEYVYQSLNRWTHGGLDDIKSAYHHYLNVHGQEGAATISFFTIFALPPLLILVVTIGSFFLEIQEIQEIIVSFVDENIPIPSETVLVFIAELLTQRTTLSIIGLVGLFWSGSGVLTSLTINIDRAFPDTRRRTIIQSRLIAFLMIGILGLLLILSSLMTTILHLIYRIDIPYLNIDPSLRIFPSLIAFFFRFLLLLGLYYWIPNTKVRRRAAFWGALVATTAMEITSRGFTLYLQSGLEFYNFLYGSLGTLVALMFWIYLNAQIIIICAHLTATLNGHINSRIAIMQLNNSVKDR
jgi:membrane protein